nr:hypothetical protein GCM10020093_107910 [Planobispora longispora]
MRPDAESTDRADLGSARGHAGGESARTARGPHFGGRAELLPARRALPAAVSGAHLPAAQGEKASFTWDDYRDLILMAHRQLDAPIVLIWDNLNRHTCSEMRQFIAASADWLRVVQLPAYAPELNPTEGIWSLLNRGGLANLAVTGLDELVRVVKRGLKKIQYRPHLIDGCLAETGLALNQL